MVVAPSMPKVSASTRRRWAISALRSNALDGMHPTFRHTPPHVVGFDDRHRQTKLRGAEGGDVAPRTRTEHYDVIPHRSALSFGASDVARCGPIVVYMDLSVRHCDALGPTRPPGCGDELSVRVIRS